jgi:hypothetical protein
LMARIKICKLQKFVPVLDVPSLTGYLVLLVPFLNNVLRTSFLIVGSSA